MASLAAVSAFVLNFRLMKNRLKPPGGQRPAAALRDRLAALPLLTAPADEE